MCSVALSRRGGVAHLVLLAVTVVAPPLSAQSRAEDHRTPFILPLTYEHRLVSAINSREYRISVALPSTYREDEPGDTTRFPVLYLLDGDVTLPATVSGFRLSTRGEGENLIMVGVGYPPGQFLNRPPPGYGQVPFRNRDYTPPPFPESDSALAALKADWKMSGDAALFLRVLREEVIPLVERNYRTTSDRGIHGHSFGGLFATYALLEDPDLFTRYLITSPSLWWNDESIFAREEALFKRLRRLDKTVYLSTGTAEAQWAVAQIWRLVSALCGGYSAEPRYEGLEVIASLNVDEPHSSGVHSARAVAAIYPGEDGLHPPAFRVCGQPRTR